MTITITKAQIEHAMNESMTVQDAASMLGICKTTLLKYRKKYNMPPLLRGGIETRLFTKRDVQIIRELHDGGMSANEIAEKFDDMDPMPNISSLNDIIAERTYRWVK